MKLLIHGESKWNVSKCKLSLYLYAFLINQFLKKPHRKDVSLPTALQRAMAAEAEAAREARAKVIAAEGEMKASRALKEASIIISESPSAMQVLYLRVFDCKHKKS